MKRLITSLVLVVVVMTTSLYSQRSEALVGFIFKNKIVKTIGAVGAIGGGALATGGLISAAVSTSAGWGGIIALVYGTMLGGVGLVILDDNELADIEFRSIDLNVPKNYQGFSIEEIKTYNSEIELLNSVRQTIVSEVSESDNTEDAESLWLEYSENLSPATFEIAKAKARLFVEAL